MSEPTFGPSYDELLSAIDGKDKEIAELRRQIGIDFMAGVVIEKDKRIEEFQKAFQMSEGSRKEWLAVFDGYKQRLIEARRLIDSYSRLAGDSTSACKEWLEGKP